MGLLFIIATHKIFKEVPRFFSYLTTNINVKSLYLTFKKYRNMMPFGFVCPIFLVMYLQVKLVVGVEANCLTRNLGLIFR